MVSEFYEHVIINGYTVDVDMITTSEDPRQFNIAYKRMRFWIEEILQDAVLIKDDHPYLDRWQATGSRVMVLPHEPVDQIIGMMIYSKLSAMAEGRIELQSVALQSGLDDNVMYHCSCDEDILFLRTEGWWQDARPIWTSNNTKHNKKNKVINIARGPEWKDHGLDWCDDAVKATTVVKNFTPKHEKE